MAFTFQMKTRVEYGVGIRHDIVKFINELKGNRVFFVIDKGLYKIGLANSILEAVKDQGIPYEIFSDIEIDPTELTVDKGVAKAKEFNPDMVVVIGGGSTICAGKGIALVLSNGGKLTDWELGKHPKSPLPTIVFPTTAGSGSEVAPRFLIKDSKTGVKRRYGGSDCYPTVAVLDPELLINLPPWAAIAASLDALSHAVEAYTSTDANPMTDAMAINAIRLLAENFTAAALTTANVEAKGKTLLASSMANIACGNAKLGLIHGLTYGPFNQPHGIECGIMLPFVLEFILPACERKMADIAEALGHKPTGDLHVDSRAAIDKVKEIYTRIGFPRSLKELNVSEDLFNEFVDISLQQVHLKTSIRPVNRKDVEMIFQNAFKGW